MSEKEWNASRGLVDFTPGSFCSVGARTQGFPLSFDVAGQSEVVPTQHTVAYAVFRTIANVAMPAILFFSVIFIILLFVCCLLYSG